MKGWFRQQPPSLRAACKRLRPCFKLALLAAFGSVGERVFKSCLLLGRLGDFTVGVHSKPYVSVNSSCNQVGFSGGQLIHNAAAVGGDGGIEQL